jgi:hypothetical protein
MKNLIIAVGIPFRALAYGAAGFILLLTSFLDVSMLKYWDWAEVKRNVVGF